MQKFSLIFSFLFAPGFLLVKYFYAFESDSFFYIGAKLLPAFFASIFFFIFMFSVLYKKNMILHFTRHFYKKELSDAEIEFLKNGDSYWMAVTFINTLLQVAFAYFADDVIWAFYSSVGWYIFFFIALTMQILYGKIFILKPRNEV